MHITIRAVSQYGQIRHYIEDREIAAAISTLTRRTTVDQADINALAKLGHTVSVTEGVTKP